MPNVKVAIKPLVALFYFENGQITKYLSWGCIYRDFSTEIFKDAIQSSGSKVYTGWAYANHKNQRGGCLSNNWEKAVKLLRKLDLINS